MTDDMTHEELMGRLIAAQKGEEYQESGGPVISEPTPRPVAGSPASDVTDDTGGPVSVGFDCPYCGYSAAGCADLTNQKCCPDCHHNHAGAPCRVCHADTHEYDEWERSLSRARAGLKNVMKLARHGNDIYREAERALLKSEPPAGSAPTRREDE